MTTDGCPEDERRRRYPIGFQRDGEEWIAVQTASFDLEPLRLVVCEPSEDAAVSLCWGDAKFLFQRWDQSPGVVHSRELSMGRPWLLWKPGQRARIALLSGKHHGRGVRRAESTRMRKEDGRGMLFEAMLEPGKIVTIAELVEDYVEDVLTVLGGNKTVAAQVLGIDRRTLYRRLARAAAKKTSRPRS